MNPKLILQGLLRRKEAGPRPRLQVRSTAVLQTATALQDWFVRLLVPLLTAAERLQLKEAATLGMPQFLRTYERILASSSALRAALELSPGYLGDLRKTHGALLRIAEQAGRLRARAEGGERLGLDELSRCLAQIEDTAAQISADGDEDGATRRQAEGLGRFLGAYRARFAQVDRMRQLRARRRVEKAQDRKAGLLRSVEMQELKKEILGPEAAAALPAPKVQTPALASTPRRRGADGEEAALLPEGAPIESCLEAKVADYQACVDDLEAHIAALAIPEIEEGALAALGEADPLLDGDLGALCAEVLPGLPWLVAATGTTAAALHELLDLLDALARLQTTAGLLAQGARDGALLVGKLALITHDQAKGWLRGQSGEEARRLRLSVEGAWELFQRSEAQKAAQTLGAKRKVAAVEAETTERLKEASFAHTAARALAGEAVPAEELRAAVAHKRKRQEDGAALPGARRKRPR